MVKKLLFSVLCLSIWFTSFSYDIQASSSYVYYFDDGSFLDSNFNFYQKLSDEEHHALWDSYFNTPQTYAVGDKNFSNSTATTKNPRIKTYDLDGLYEGQMWTFCGANGCDYGFNDLETYIYQGIPAGVGSSFNIRMQQYLKPPEGTSSLVKASIDACRAVLTNGDTSYEYDCTSLVSFDSNTNTFTVLFDYDNVDINVTHIMLSFVYNTFGYTEGIWSLFDYSIVAGSQASIGDAAIVGSIDETNNILSGIASQISGLTGKDYSEILQSIYSELQATNQNIISGFNTIGGYMSQVITALGNALFKMDIQIQDLKSIVLNTQGTNDRLDNTNSLLNQVIEYMTSGNSGSQESVGNMDDTNSNLNNSITDYDEIEKGQVEDFNTNIGNLDTNLGILNLSDFTTSAMWLSNQMTRIVTSNNVIQYMITFSLIIGFALVLIGRGLH